MNFALLMEFQNNKGYEFLYCEKVALSHGRCMCRLVRAFSSSFVLDAYMLLIKLSAGISDERFTTPVCLKDDLVFIELFLW